MGLVFRPGVWRAGVMFELPRPIPVLRIEDRWDYTRLKVPLRAGDELAGVSADGVDIVIQGQFGSRLGAVTADESAMFAALEGLREAVRGGPDDPPYELFLYYDPEGAVYRKFRSCRTVRFECDLSNVHLFGYELVVHAEEPGISGAGPGE
jgi:hypothetical protein